VGNVSVVTTYDLPTAVISLVRILAVVIALFMASTMLHGHELKRHTGGNHERHAAAHGIFHDGLIGVIISLAVAVAAPHLLKTVFTLANLA
jgi:L-asparagine transporter-like permease